MKCLNVIIIFAIISFLAFSVISIKAQQTTNNDSNNNNNNEITLLSHGTLQTVKLTATQSTKTFTLNLSKNQKIGLLYMQQQSKCKNLIISFDGMQSFNGEYKIATTTIEHQFFECVPVDKYGSCSLKVTLSCKDTSTTTTETTNNHERSDNNYSEATVYLLPLDTDSVKLYLTQAATTVVSSLVGIIILIIITFIILITCIIILAFKLRKVNKEVEWIKGNSATVLPLSNFSNANHYNNNTVNDGNLVDNNETPMFTVNLQNYNNTGEFGMKQPILEDYQNKI